MDDLIDEAWRVYHASAGNDVIVRPSIPILFFGDSERYARSPRKVITVGLNPSWREFAVADGFGRFPEARHAYPSILRGDNRGAYLDALNGYFRVDPYAPWFASYEWLLTSIGCSYYGREPSTALHTDLCSPLATRPTWSRLGERQERLMADGVPLWHRLVDRLGRVCKRGRGLRFGAWIAPN